MQVGKYGSCLSVSSFWWAEYFICLTTTWKENNPVLFFFVFFVGLFFSNRWETTCGYPSRLANMLVRITKLTEYTWVVEVNTLHITCMYRLVVYVDNVNYWGSWITEVTNRSVSRIIILNILKSTSGSKTEHHIMMVKLSNESVVYMRAKPWRVIQTDHGSTAVCYITINYLTLPVSYHHT